jgi:hypothetical protein
MGLETMSPCSSARPKISIFAQQLSELDCPSDVRQALVTRPFCSCSFSLPKIEYWNDLPDALAVEVGAAVSDCLDMVSAHQDRILAQLEVVSKSKQSHGASETARATAEKLSSGTPFAEYAAAEFHTLSAAAVAALPELHQSPFPNGPGSRPSPVSNVNANA